MVSYKGIMMVDDDAEDQDVLADALKTLNAEEPLYFEKDGVEAIECLEKLFAESSLPCLLIADLNMPRIGGLQLLQQLKKDDRFKKIPIVIYSTSANSMEREQCLRSGAHAYITKPLTYQENLEVARQLLTLCSELSVSR
jgi:CheY-like chemotaxis protein